MTYLELYKVWLKHCEAVKRYPEECKKSKSSKTMHETEQEWYDAIRKFYGADVRFSWAGHQITRDCTINPDSPLSLTFRMPKEYYNEQE